MNKGQLQEAISNKAEISKADAGRVLDVIVAEITENLKNGDEVKLPGLGSFSISERSERTGRNPQTGESITIPAAKTVRFKAYKALKDAVN